MNPRPTCSSQVCKPKKEKVSSTSSVRGPFVVRPITTALPYEIKMTKLWKKMSSPWFCIGQSASYVKWVISCIIYLSGMALQQEICLLDPSASIVCPPYSKLWSKRCQMCQKEQQRTCEAEMESVRERRTKEGDFQTPRANLILYFVFHRVNTQLNL